MGADKAGQHPAAFDIGAQHHRHIRGLGKTHIGDIAFAQVGLGGAAGAFDQNQIGVPGDDMEAFQHPGQ